MLEVDAVKVRAVTCCVLVIFFAVLMAVALMLPSGLCACGPEWTPNAIEQRQRAATPAALPIV
jgi:hypothetical protein